MPKRVILIISIIIFIPSFIASGEAPSSPNYSLKEPRIVISIGDSESTNYSLNNVIVGNAFGVKAESLNYILRTYVTSNPSFAITPLNWALSAIAPGAYKITDEEERLIVRNVGDVKLSYTLRVMDVSDTWEAAHSDNGSLNIYAISAVFTDTNVKGVDNSNFNESGDDDLILSGSQFSTDAKFATTISVKNGADVTPGEERALWLKFTAPTIDTTQEETHNLWLIIEAKGGE